MKISKGIADLVLVASLAIITAGNASAESRCGFRQAFTRPDEGGSKTVKVFEARAVTLSNGKHPLLFLSSLKVNTDGATISYHQDDPTGKRCERDPSATPCAINNIRNAYNNAARPVSDFTAVRDKGYPLPRTWQVLSPSIVEKDAKTGKPCVTQEGYLVSMTADVAIDGARAGDCDPAKWIDALTAPAIVLPRKTRAIPSEFIERGLRKRSLVVAVSGGPNRKTVPGIVGDFGPAKELGEATVAMNRELNGLPPTEKPKNRTDAIARFQAGRTALLLFPGPEFVLDRPITGARISAAGTNALTKFGGSEKLVDCIRQDIDPGF